MKVAFFTEWQWIGNVERSHPNMRTDMAWMAAMNAKHYPVTYRDISESFDLGIIIVPKKNPNLDITVIKNVCRYTAIMQEGPNWYWQDWTMSEQGHYLNLLHAVDFLLAHNESDVKYYKGITGKQVFILPSLMIEDAIPKSLLIPEHLRYGVMIGGNFCSWYGGVDSYMVALQLKVSDDESMGIPSMGRMQSGEDQIADLNHIPYSTWKEWLISLSHFKYAVHLMRTHAA